jgi:hypothetical protein
MKQIKLSIERFWMETGNFELWPDTLSQLPQQIQARSIKELAAKYLFKDLSQKDKSKDLYGLQGCEYHFTSKLLEIKGVHYIQLTNDGYSITEDGLELVERYKNQAGWEAQIARQVIKYSPRCRAIMYPLWRGGHLKTAGNWLERLFQAKLCFEDQIYAPFVAKQDALGLNRLLDTFREESLGKYWRAILQEMDIAFAVEWNFVGSSTVKPADANLSSLLRSPFALFNYLQWFIEKKNGEVYLNKDQIYEDLQGEEPFSDLGSIPPLSILEAFRKLIAEYGDYRGLFPVEIVLSQLQERYFPDWRQGPDRFVDSFLTQGIKDGLFRIVGNESGQPRHGRGYLGKRENQLLKMEFYQ